MFFLILSLYSATYFFKKNKIKYFYLLPLFVSLSINVRMIGIYIYLIFLLLFFLNFIFDKNKKNLKFISQTSLQILILIISLYILTPQVWTDPIFKFAELFYGQLTNSDINPKILFMGHMKDSADLNSYYLILWIAISTPVMTLILFLMGLTLIFLKLFKLLSVKKTNPSLILILLYLFLPLFAVLAFQPNIFNGWRHFYFLYPGIVFIATYAINFILEESNLKLLKKIFTFFIIFNFLYLCHWSIKNHPYEYVFLNFLSKKFANKFEGDYWGLSDFQSIKYILNNDQRKNIKITGLNGDRIDFTVNILENKLKNRVEIKYPISKGLLINGINLNKKDLKEVDYFITRLNQKYNINYYLKNGFKKFQTISVNNRIISATFTQEN